MREYKHLRPEVQATLKVGAQDFGQNNFFLMKSWKQSILYYPDVYLQMNSDILLSGNSHCSHAQILM